MPISDDFWSSENKQDDPDEAEETLSSNLPMYGNVEETGRISSSSSNHDQEVFEFEFDLSGLKDEAESIIFCGKLIPNREASLENKTNPQQKNFNKRENFGRKSSSSSCSKSRSSSMLAKSKWYGYMFGLGRFPVEMDLRDMKNRQSRRSQTRMFCSQEDKIKGRGFWGLMHHANTMIKSFTCI